MKKNSFYGISCIIMTAVTTLCLIASVIYQLSSENIFLSSFTNILLIVFAFLTLICLCVSSIHRGGIYKLGFYILHIGLVLLTIGFVIFNFFGRQYTVSVLKDGKYYNTIKDGETTVDLGFYFRLNGVETEYYDESDDKSDGQKSVKQYYAYLSLVNSESETSEVILSVNNPAKINGYKVYLMNIATKGDIGATLLFKYDPSELTVYSGIILLIIGSFAMCYFGGFGKTKKRSSDSATASGNEVMR